MKKIYAFITSLMIASAFFTPNAGAVNANLTITAMGTSSTLPIGDWTNCIVENGHNYTINLIDLSKLITEHDGKLTLAFDSITINGNIDLNFTGSNLDIDLKLLLTDPKNGGLVVNDNSRLTIVTDEGKTSTLTLACPMLYEEIYDCFTVDHIIFSDETQEYRRIMQPGFTKWTQKELDDLLAKASHVGASITDLNGEYKANDFTEKTKFTVENGVFTMTAEADFLNDNGMGFKNMDREGTLSGMTNGAYPAGFYNDLSGSDGIRFKVNVSNGTAEYLNIGLSNCATTIFEHFIYSIPLTAADDEGYITLPFSLFEAEFWGEKVLQLNNCKVFIIEVINVTNGTSISFSDFHAYKLEAGNHKQLYINRLKIESNINIKEMSFHTTGSLTQQPSSASWIGFNGKINMQADTVNLLSMSNSFQGNIAIQANHINMHLGYGFSYYDPSHFSFIPFEGKEVTTVIVDGDTIEPVTEYTFDYKDEDAVQHTLMVIFGSKKADSTLTIKGDTTICEGNGTTLKVVGTATTYQWYYEEYLLSDADSLVIPDTIPAGNYPLKLVAKWHPDNNLTVSPTATIIRNIDFNISRTDHVDILDTVYLGETYEKNGFKITPREVGTMDLDLTLTNSLGCDSIVTLHLTTIQKSDRISEYNFINHFYPNPTHGLITVQLGQQYIGSELRLYDIHGRLVMVKIVQDESEQLNLYHLTNGIYLLKAGRQTVKIIKE